MANTKTPNTVDREIGARVRMWRQERGLSQEKLGDALGLTFQQVQKYEKGTNRIGGSRLTQIAAILKVSASTLLGEGEPEGDHSTAPLLAEAGALELLRMYHRMDRKQRGLVIAVCAQMTGGSPAEAEVVNTVARVATAAARGDVRRTASRS